THQYLIFDPNLMKVSQETQLLFPCAAWGTALSQSLQDFGLTFCGEWSVAADDCALYLNGVGGKSAYDGSCANCTCVGANDWENWTPQKKAFLRQFTEVQMDALEMGNGWFFWTWKTENNINPVWDYQLGL
ncbi:16379_t:CDS:2, partial [Acaulospora morrowiae]